MILFCDRIGGYINYIEEKMMKLGIKNVLSFVVCSVLALGLFGCKSDDAIVGGGDDMVAPTDMSQGGDYALSPRTEFGSPITNVDFENVAFPYDNFQIADSERGKIEAVADYMNSNQDVTVVVDGHCDERGSREYNLSLGEHRALAVRAYLIALGVGGEKVQTRSFGEEQPLDPGHNAAAWSRNRRAEFSLYRQ